MTSSASTVSDRPHKYGIPHLLGLFAVTLVLLTRRLLSPGCLTTVLVFLITFGESDITSTTVYAAANDVKTSRVLYLNSYNRGYKWSDDIERGLLERFQTSGRKIEMSVEFLDSRRFPDNARIDSLAETLAAKYSGYHHDLVVVSDNFAFDLATRYRKQLFPELPIVFCGYNNFRPEVINGISNITGVNEEVDISKTVQLAIKVQPSIRTLAFIISTRDASSRMIAEIAENLVIPKYREHYKLIVLKDAPLSEIQSRLGSLSKESAVILAGQTSDRKEGRELTPEENGRIISSASPVPVYSFWDFHLGTGILGGHIITGFDQGRASADLALRILGGTPAYKIPVVMETPAREVFDFNAMKRFGVSGKALSEGSSVINRPDSAWERYKSIIMGTIGFFLMMSLVIIILILNILKRRKAEHSLSIERNRAQLYLDTVEIIIVALDADGRIATINRKGCRILGYSEAELLGKNWFETCLPQPEGRETLYPFYLQLMGGDTSLLQEYQENPIITRSAVLRYISWHNSILRDDQGQIIGTLSAGEDITGRKQAEEELAKSAREWSEAMDISSDAICLLGLERHVVRANKAFYSVTGANPETTTGRHIADIMHPQCKAITCPSCKAQEELRDAHIIMEKENPDNPVGKPVEITVKIVRDSEQRPLSIFMSIHDLTVSRREIEERQQLEIQLQQAQKMESIGRLAGGVAHDFNNILTVIAGYTSLGLMGSDPSQPSYAKFEEIRNAAERAADLTHQLLAFAHKQVIAPKVLDLNHSVTAMRKMVQRLIGENVKLDCQAGENLWRVMMDSTQIDQILANLCVNARDAIKDVGSITIETENCCLDENYCAKHMDANPGEYVLLSVSDTGCGMDEATVSHIFEPFFTTKGLGEGTGLGLATVYGIVKQNSGFIDVLSKPGSGTTFKIYLPRYSGEEEQKHLEKTESTIPRGNETILVVEDDIAILNFIKAILEKQGYTVIAENSPNKAIRLARENAGNIQLLITDVVMPEMNGRELATALQSLSLQLKCLFMSGYTTDVIERQGVLISGVSFIQKPFSMHGLAIKVREMLDSVQ